MLIRSPGPIQIGGLWWTLGDIKEKLEEEEESVSPITSKATT